MSKARVAKRSAENSPPRQTWPHRQIPGSSEEHLVDELPEPRPVPATALAGEIARASTRRSDHNDDSTAQRLVKDSVDVLVIGSGIGGLCCAGLCAKSGRDVLVLEAHHQPGGAAHGFQRQGYHLESGPSLWSGLGRWPSNNPLAQVLRALGQTLEVVPYSTWDVLSPRRRPERCRWQ
jgi:hypothetical protein